MAPAMSVAQGMIQLRKMVKLQIQLNNTKADILSRLYRGEFTFEELDRKKCGTEMLASIQSILTKLPEGLDVNSSQVEREIWSIMDPSRVSSCHLASELQSALLSALDGQQTQEQAGNQFGIPQSTMNRNVNKIRMAMGALNFKELCTMYSDAAQRVIIEGKVKELFAVKLKRGPNPYLSTAEANILGTISDCKDEMTYGLDMSQLSTVIRDYLAGDGAARKQMWSELLVEVQKELDDLDEQAELDKIQTRRRADLLQQKKTTSAAIKAEGQRIVSKIAPATVKRTLNQQSIAQNITFRSNSYLSVNRQEGSSPLIFNGFITGVVSFIARLVTAMIIPRVPGPKQFRNYDEFGIGTAKSRKKFRLGPDVDSGMGWNSAYDDITLPEQPRRQGSDSQRRFNTSSSEHNDFWTTGGLCTNAEGGLSVKPIVLHQMEGDPDTIRGDLAIGLPNDYIVGTSPSGYMTRSMQMRWAMSFQRATGACQENPQFLFLDAHDSHWGSEFLRFCRFHYIFVFFLPSNGSVNDQPNDNGPNAVIKSLYGKYYGIWRQRNGGKKFSPMDCNWVLTQAMNEFERDTGNVGVVRRAFALCGIFPPACVAV